MHAYIHGYGYITQAVQLFKPRSPSSWARAPSPFATGAGISSRSPAQEHLELLVIALLTGEFDPEAVPLLREDRTLHPVGRQSGAHLDNGFAVNSIPRRNE